MRPSALGKLIAWATEIEAASTLAGEGRRTIRVSPLSTSTVTTAGLWAEKAASMATRRSSSGCRAPQATKGVSIRRVRPSCSISTSSSRPSPEQAASTRPSGIRA